MTEKIKCPKCGWGSRVTFLHRTKSYKCDHCGHKWNPEKEKKLLSEEK
jgi:transposase-like protein